MGYAQNGLQAGATLVAPQFLNVGSDAMPLEAIVPTGDDTADNVSIQTCDAYGFTVDTYNWNNWVAEQPCWVDDNFEIVSGVTFQPGQGLWVFGSDSTQGIQTAGKVGTSDVVVQLQSGATATGNPFPTTLALTDIVPLGEDTADNVSIQTCDAYGFTVDTYNWNDWVAEEPCWVDDNFEIVTGVTFAPGAGLWVFGSSSSQSIRFPAPEL